VTHETGGKVDKIGLVGVGTVEGVKPGGGGSGRPDRRPEALDAATLLIDEDRGIGTPDKCTKF
jgi:hypothetical protein